MDTIVYLAKDRGIANYDWLQAKYSFSFANYYDSEKVNFGALRVLNDDIIAAGMGFGKHPHDNMEIITIPLEGALKHRDSMSNEWIPLHTGEVQVMSAGTGLMHSEMNNSTKEPINLFQIWIQPSTKNIKPLYDQKQFDASLRKNKLQILVSSINNEVEGGLKIYQDAQISRIDLDATADFKYVVKSKNHGVYVMVIDGEIEVVNKTLGKRDAIGISQTTNIYFTAKRSSELLFIEVPMNF